MLQVVDILLSGIQYGLIFALLALGVFISFRILDFADLSIEGTLPLGAMICAWMINLGLNPVMSCLVAMIGGAAAGAFTGLLHTKLRINSLISGIITMGCLFTINLVIGGLARGDASASSIMIKFDKSLFNGLNVAIRDFLNIGGNSFLKANQGNKIATALIASGFVIVMFNFIYWFFGTEFGMALRATGDNQKMAKAQGIHTSLMIIVGLAMSNALIALCGSLFLQVNGSADVNLGRGAIVIGLASIIIGEMLFGSKKATMRKSLISVVIGTIVFYTIRAIVIQLSVLHFLELLVSLLVMVVLAYPVIKDFSKKLLKKERRGC